MMNQKTSRSCLKNSDFAFRQGREASSSAVYTPVNEQRRSFSDAASMQNSIFETASKFTLFMGILTLPSLTFAFFCPTNFNQIDFGMTPDQVTQACGKPDTQKEYKKQNENIPQEWNYFVPQSVNMGGSSQNVQGTLKTSISFDDQGKAINISVNGIGVGATSICGGTSIQLGADKDTVKNACGTPSFINKQTSETNPSLQTETKVMEFNYMSAVPSVTLIFENGKLTDKK